MIFALYLVMHCKKFKYFVRYFEKNCHYHIVSKTFQSRMLLRPDKKGELKKIVYGVLSRAREHYPSLKLYGFAFLSNHFHMQLSSSNVSEIPLFIRFVKSEISRRWSNEIGWGDSLWNNSSYKMTALSNSESRIKSLKYILSQGCKEGLVAKPELWPGPNCAEYFFKPMLHNSQRFETLKGYWFNATEYAFEKRKVSADKIHKNDFKIKTELSLDILECWDDLRMENLFQELNVIYKEIITEAKDKREGKPFLGRREVFKISRAQKGFIEKDFWLERKSHILSWTKMKCLEAQNYLSRFFIFQEAYLECSQERRKGSFDLKYPEGCFQG